MIVFWLAFLGVLAFATTWMALAAVLVGVWLYLMQIEVLSWRSFVLVRRYGLWGALRRGKFRVATGRTRASESEQPGRGIVVTTLISVPFLSAAAAAALPLLVGTFTPHRFVVLDDILARTAILAGILGAIVGSVCWIQGLNYVARPGLRRRWGRLPCISLPAELGRTARDQFALTIFWHDRIRTAAIFASIYPWLWIAFLPMGSNSAHSADPPSQVHFSAAGLLAVILLFVSSVVPALTVAGIAERRMVSAHLYLELYSLLWNREDNETSPQGQLTLPTDPLGSQRVELAQIADHLSTVARRLDAHQPRGFSPHPIATLLRGCHHSIHQFLRSKNSLVESIPTSLKEILTMVVAVLVGPPGLTVYHQLDARVAAFDQDGDPAVELTSKPPGRLAVLADRTTRGIQRINAVTVSVATIIALLLAVILAILGRISLTTLIGHLR